MSSRRLVIVLRTFTRSHSTSTTKITSSSFSSSVDVAEVSKFRLLADRWWNENGEFQALHSLNQLPPFNLHLSHATEKTIQTPTLAMSTSKNFLEPLKGFKLLDIGCGGGLLAEPLARLGASILGIDACLESIETAKLHADLSLTGRLNYKHVTLEQLCEDQSEHEKYDAIIASEVFEHINDIDKFVENTNKLLKSGGLCFVTTINRTVTSYVVAILGAEYLFRAVPQGTHDWNRLIKPVDLTMIFEKMKTGTA
ncbi:unnamed protein product [Didymodactylos carnosus]|uniref:3-demethylubiquinol 3-O-methyltransferase n=1 Tax=Didymodactylos carnosus TaxID=1234261 RepID=A0A8S2GR82_9BILA|nr:unnamed protein product [Didymodactylos carnosus]CAF3547917.1 unnamed protein product [Didymodactylos carnosus]